MPQSGLVNIYVSAGSRSRAIPATEENVIHPRIDIFLRIKFRPGDAASLPVIIRRTMRTIGLGGRVSVNARFPRPMMVLMGAGSCVSLKSPSTIRFKSGFAISKASTFSRKIFASSSRRSASSARGIGTLDFRCASISVNS